MTADSIRIYELQNVCLLLSLLIEPVAAEQAWIVIFGPAKGRDIDLEIGNHLVVEPVRADGKLVDPSEEQAALPTRDQPLVISAGQRDYLADTQLAESSGRHRLILSGILDGTGRDYCALPRHKTRV